MKRERGVATIEATPYIGGVPLYRETCADVAAKGYEGFELVSG